MPHLREDDLHPETDRVFAPGEAKHRHPIGNTSRGPRSDNPIPDFALRAATKQFTEPGEGFPE